MCVSSLSTNIYIYTHIYIHIHIYVYIYIFFSPEEVKLQSTYAEINQASHLLCLIEF